MTTMTSSSMEDNSHCMVAESDYQAALKAIESTFVDALSSSDDLIARKMIEETHASLVKSLGRIVQPVSDQTYHDVIDSYHIVMEDDDDDESDEENEEMLEEEDYNEVEIDEEDLLDAKAFATAKEKREQVRTLSRRIQQIRYRVLDRVAVEASKPFEDKDGASTVRVEPPSTEEDAVKPCSLKTSLEDLDTILNDSKIEELPKQSERLQNTIEAVQKEIEKDRPLSQTEVAIVSRSNSAVEEETQEEYLRLSQPVSMSNNNMGGDALTPADRLAFFFQGYE